MYARGAKAYQFRAGLAPAGAADAKLSAVSIVENNPGEVVVDAEFAAKDAAKAVVRFALPIGQAFVRTEARQGVKALAVDAPCRYLVLPDFFADDIVIDASELPVASAELPSENFLIQLLPGGESLLMTVLNTREQDAVVQLDQEVLAGQLGAGNRHSEASDTMSVGENQGRTCGKGHRPPGP